MRVRPSPLFSFPTRLPRFGAIPPPQMVMNGHSGRSFPVEADPLGRSFTSKPSGKRFPSFSGRVANAVKSLPTAWGRVADELFDPARECRQGFELGDNPARECRQCFEEGNDPARISGRVVHGFNGAARECRQPFESGDNLPRDCRRPFEDVHDPARECRHVFYGVRDPAQRLECPGNAFRAAFGLPINCRTTLRFSNGFHPIP